MLGLFVSAAGLPQQLQADISPVCGEGAPGSLPVEVWDVLLEAFLSALSSKSLLLTLCAEGGPNFIVTSLLLVSFWLFLVRN